VKRRNLLTTAATGLGVALAGCVAGGDGDGGNGDGGSGSGSADGTTSGGGGSTTDSGDGSADAPDGNASGSDDGSTDAAADGSGGSDGSDGSGDTGGSTVGVADTAFDARRECSGSTGARVEFAEDALVATGCIRGPDGCHVAALKDVALRDGTLRIVVTTEAEGGTDTMCSQAIVRRGYEATVSTTGGRPSTVEVVHVSMGERETVATAEP
jgi:hypothetical protein